MSIVNRLDEFYKLLGVLRKAKSMIESVTDGVDKKTWKEIKSRRLKALTTFTDFTKKEEKK